VTESKLRNPKRKNEPHEMTLAEYLALSEKIK
jgi:hypothetical protein